MNQQDASLALSVTVALSLAGSGESVLDPALWNNTMKLKCFEFASNTYGTFHFGNEYELDDETAAALLAEFPGRFEVLSGDIKPDPPQRERTIPPSPLIRGAKPQPLKNEGQRGDLNCRRRVPKRARERAHLWFSNSRF